MRFLICLRGEVLSRETLRFGTLMASRLGTDITILFVAERRRRSFSTEAHIADAKMGEWKLSSPGNEVLLAARDHLESMGLIGIEPGRRGPQEVMMPRGEGSFEIEFAGGGGTKVAFIYRWGDVLDEIMAELRSRRYDLLVIGGSKKRGGMTPVLLRFTTVSTLIVKHPKDIRYRILVGTDGSPPAHRAELLAIKTASFFKWELTLLAAVKTDKERAFMEKHLARMAALCELKRVPCRLLITGGDPVRLIAEEAGEDHVIFAGSSRRSLLTKLLLGSKAVRIAAAADCPLLMVK